MFAGWKKRRGECSWLEVSIILRSTTGKTEEEFVDDTPPLIDVSTAVERGVACERDTFCIPTL